MGDQEIGFLALLPLLLATCYLLPATRTLLIGPLELPGARWQVGEAEEVVAFQFDVPLELLPALRGVPPVAGTRKGAEGAADAAAMGAGEQGERAREGALLVEGDRDLDGWTETGEGEAERGMLNAERRTSNIECGTSKVGWRRIRRRRESGSSMFDVPEQLFVGGKQVEAVGAVGEGRDGEADAVGADERLEAGEGVGEAVGLAQLMAEEQVLAVVRIAGNQGEGEAGDRSGELELVEVGLERLQEDFGRGAWLGKADGLVMRCLFFELQFQLESGGAEVAAMEPTAEDPEAAPEGEQERHRGLDPVLEVPAGDQRLGWLEELERALGPAVDQVVEAGELRAEPLGETLPRQVGEVTEPPQAPEVEQSDVLVGEGPEEGEGKRFERGARRAKRGMAAGFPAAVGTAEDEAVAGGGGEGEQVGEVGRRSHSDPEGEAERGDFGVWWGLVLVLEFLSGPKSEIRPPPFHQQDGVGGGQLEVGREGLGELEEVAAGEELRFGIALENLEFRATGEGPGDRQPGCEPETGCAAVAVPERRVFPGRGRREQGAGGLALLRPVPEQRLQGEVGEMEGEVDGGGMIG